MSSASIKQALHHLADELPDTATWKDVAYEAYVRQELEAGLHEARCGDFAEDTVINDTFAKWSVQAIYAERSSSPLVR